MNRAIPSAARTTKPPKPSPSVHPRQRRFTVEEYHRLGEIGFLTENDRCELIRGVIVEKPVINPAHKTALRRTAEQLRRLFPPEFLLDSQGPVTLADSEPEPDISVTAGPDDRYLTRHAGPDEVVLLVEVADSSLEHDRGDKLQLYAEAGIAVYWIVNIPDRIVEVYTRPRGGRTPGYRTRNDYTPGMTVPVVIGKKTVGTIPVNEMLP